MLIVITVKSMFTFKGLTSKKMFQILTIFNDDNTSLKEGDKVNSTHVFGVLKLPLN